MRVGTENGNMGATEPKTMTDDRRALLTPDERAVLMGEREVSDNHKYTVVSRVRKKVQRVEQDLEALEEYSDGKLADELRDVVCE